MANIVYVATSLDGFIARKDGTLDWLFELPNPERTDYGFSSFWARIDGVLMGRKTLETVLGFKEWPYNKPVFVLSNSLKQLPGHLSGKAEIVRGDLNQILPALGDRGIINLYIDGGETVRSFLHLDLIDELIISRVPIVLGSGLPLFTELSTEFRFKHISTDVFENGVVKSRYSRVRA